MHEKSNVVPEHTEEFNNKQKGVMILTPMVLYNPNEFLNLATFAFIHDAETTGANNHTHESKCHQEE